MVRRPAVAGRPALHLRPARVRRRRARDAHLRLPRGPQPARGRAVGARARGGDGAADADLPRQRHDPARLARRGDDRRADRARQPPRAGPRPRASCCPRPTTPARSCSCCSTSTASSTTTTPSATPRATRCSSASAATSRTTCPAAAARSGWAATSSARSSTRATRSPTRSSPAPRTALTERGEGFTVTCSYGAIVLPREAMDATEALRIADQRMYAQKNAGRTSATRQSKAVLVRALSERNPELFTDLEGVAELAEATARRLGLRRGGGRADQPRRRAARHRQGRDPRRHPLQARPARPARVGVHPPPHADRRAHHRRRARARRRRPPRPLEPRALGRHRLPGPPPGPADPARRPRRRRRRRVQRHDLRAPLQPRGHARARDHGAAPPRRHAVRPRRRRGVLRRPGRSSAPPAAAAGYGLTRTETRRERRAAVRIAGLRHEPRLEAVARLHERAPEAVGEAEATLRVGPARCRSAPAAAHPGRARRSSHACPCEPARPSAVPRNTTRWPLRTLRGLSFSRKPARTPSVTFALETGAGSSV